MFPASYLLKIISSQEGPVKDISPHMSLPPSKYHLSIYLHIQLTGDGSLSPT